MNEDLSRLMDGDLLDAEVDRVVGECRRDGALATWACYHVIGDSLRGAPAAMPRFSRRFAQTLAAEPTVLAPRRRPPPTASWAWAAAATIAAVAVVGWTAVSLTEDPATAVAKAREAGSVTREHARQQALPQDYVLAHQQYTPATAYHGVSPYVRAVAAPIADGGR
ncbi:MAG: sigma-E factor negative regulatory protein [Betaproteobacteria bacterium]|nr:sigma-E factor negative regulatory protein [Betaproteobacteria bacterium]